MALAALFGPASFLFIATTLDHQYQEVLRGIYTETNASAIGCPSKDLIVSNPRSNRPLVAVMAFQLRRVQIIVEHGVAYSPEDATRIGNAFAEQVAAHLSSAVPGTAAPVLLILFDNRLVAHCLIDTLANTLGPLVPIAGGALLYPQTPISMGVAHGWLPSGHAVVTTHVEQNRIYELNGRPAFEVYCEVWQDIFPDIAGKTHQEIQQEFTRFALYYPLGLAQVTGEYLIRDPYQVLEDGSILCAAGISANAVLHFMHGTRKTLMHSAQTAAQQAIAQLGNHSLEAALAFDCISRFLLPDYTIQDEFGYLQTAIGPTTPILMVASVGEIANPTRGLTIHHNKALVLSLFTRKASPDHV
jgi:hypothetical protein